ncbi:MAG: hypothetical protein HY482_01645 [Candidatus Wildermuthbacteria bacterium]|nr:hypothetical protein [Candidatus Wildermuthbacteria bacterium]
MVFQEIRGGSFAWLPHRSEGKTAERVTPAFSPENARGGSVENHTP